MYEVKFYKSKWKGIKLILLSLPFVLYGIWNLNQGNPDTSVWIDWLSISFFGLGIPLGIFNLFDRRPELILNEEGIFDRMAYGIFNKQTNAGNVKWESINEAYLLVHKNNYRGLPLSDQKFICLNLKKHDSRKRKSKLAKAFGSGDFDIPLMNLKKLDEQKLIDFIKAMMVADSKTKRNLLQSFKQA